ncbi:MAG: tetratricopeptide repeat protein [Sulfurovum sp.]|nr:tetratricopeptide repeat protein [Sulfurovum sp.]
MMPLKLLLFFSMILSSELFAIFGSDLAEQNHQRILAMQRIIAEQNERIDGLISLIEGLNSQIAKRKVVKKQIPQHGESGETLNLIKDLGNMIDEINNNYVSKSDLEKIVNLGKFTIRKKKKIATSQKDFNRRPASALYSEGVRLFVKKRYDEARRHFYLTVKKGYKSAASNYYLGEIAYYTKQYSSAIFYYKKSASLHDKAGYMDVLLLHTAISLDKTGEKEQARIFYENVIENYPGRKSTTIAKKRLMKI